VVEDAKEDADEGIEKDSKTNSREDPKSGKESVT
jgi:hypothetical protein